LRTTHIIDNVSNFVLVNLTDVMHFRLRFFADQKCCFELLTDNVIALMAVRCWNV